MVRLSVNEIILNWNVQIYIHNNNKSSLKNICILKDTYTGMYKVVSSSQTIPCTVVAKLLT